MGSAGPTTTAYKDILSAALDASYQFCTDKKKDLIKLTGYTAGWTEIKLGTDNIQGQIAGKIGGFMGDAKNLFSALELPQKANELKKEVSNFYKEPSFARGTKVLCKGVAPLVNTVSDAFDLCTKFCPVSEITKQNVKWYNSVATLTGALYGTVSSGKEACNKGISTSERFEKCLTTASAASYVGLALVHLLYRDKAKSWHYLACVTSGALFGAGAFFYGKLFVNNGANPSPSTSTLPTPGETPSGANLPIPTVSSEEMDRLKQENETLKTENEGLKVRLNLRANSPTVPETTGADSSNEATRLQKANEDLFNENASLKQQLKMEKDTSEDQLKIAADNLERALKEKTKLTNDLASEKKKNKNLEEFNKNSNKDLNTLKANYEEQINHLREKHKQEIDSVAGKRSKEIDDLNSTITAQSEKLKESEKHSSKLTLENQRIAKELSDANEKITKLQDENDQIKRARDKLLTVKSDKKNTVLNLETPARPGT